jgi:succinate dehydrogenase / fumarate reductase cytochrome b subunit
MRRVVTLYRSSVGKKAVMAVTGTVLFLFVLGHMAGNLKVFQGPEKINAYADFLREVGGPVLGPEQFLWIARIALLVVVALHIVSATQLTLAARRARPVKYQRPVHLEDTYASRTMVWGGIIVVTFVVYHLLHLTLGSAHPDFRAGDVYYNLVSGFQVWPVSIGYIIAMVALGLHIYHGVWSAFQTLGANHPKYNSWRRIFAGVVTGLIVIGNVSIPVAVLTGIVE